MRKVMLTLRKYFDDNMATANISLSFLLQE